MRPDPPGFLVPYWMSCLVVQQHNVSYCCGKLFLVCDLTAHLHPVRIEDMCVSRLPVQTVREVYIYLKCKSGSLSWHTGSL